jgi:hypothetical protein
MNDDEDNSSSPPTFRNLLQLDIRTERNNEFQIHIDDVNDEQNFSEPDDSDEDNGEQTDEEDSYFEMRQNIISGER